MMDNPYDLHSWSKLYREEALQGARTRQLVEQAKAGRVPRESGRFGLVWRKPLALLRGA
jgi:hypothetical protein